MTNAAGSIAATIPTAWIQVRSLSWTNDRQQVVGHTLVASRDVEAFLRWEAEGVAISVSRHLGLGYVQLLDQEYPRYQSLCNDPFLRFWDFENLLHRGKYFVLNNCGGVTGGWLSVLSVVPVDGTRRYTAEVLAYDMPPTYGEDFRDIVMRFEVFADKLP